jgi:hypothetical protein
MSASLHLACTHFQVLIQDIFNGKSGSHTFTHVNVCFASNELHQASAHSIAIQLMLDIHKFDSDLRSLLPSIVCVHWTPDRAGRLSQLYRSAHTEQTHHSQLSHFVTEGAGRSTERKLLSSRGRKALGGGILKSASDVDSKANTSGKSKRWELVAKPRVHIILGDKRVEANRIFDTLDFDVYTSVTGAEIFLAMMRNGFDEDEIAARMPSLLQPGGSPLTREVFVNLWVNTREVDPSRLFDRLDVDGSDGISYTELQAGLMQEGYAAAEIRSHLPSILKAMDVDGDGQISRKEFVSHWRRLHESGFASTSLGSMLGVVKSVTKDNAESALRVRQTAAVLSPLTYLPPALRGFPASSASTAPSDRIPQEVEAAGVFSGIATTASEIFGAVGVAIIPEHLQDAIVLQPDGANAASRSRLLRPQPLSPREMIARALAPSLPTQAEGEDAKGWAATLRRRLGAPSSQDRTRESSAASTATGFSMSLQPLSSLFSSFPGSAGMTADSTSAIEITVTPNAKPLDVGSPHSNPSCNRQGQ